MYCSPGNSEAGRVSFLKDSGYGTCASSRFAKVWFRKPENLALTYPKPLQSNSLKGGVLFVYLLERAETQYTYKASKAQM